MYTQENFSEYNKPFKNELEQTIASLIRFNTDSTLRQGGVAIVSLVGPNLRKHVRNYAKLQGRSQFHIVERVAEVYEQQLQQSKYVAGNYQLHAGDYWSKTISLYQQNKLRGQIVYLDFDACACLEVIVRENYHKMRKVAKLAAERQHTVWLSVTFSTRTGLLDEQTDQGELITKLTRSFTSTKCGWKVATLLEMPYRDGQPMCTVLIKFVR